MPYSFDEQKKYSENLEDFLTAMDAVDEDMSKILRANAAKLATIVRDGERDPGARAEFNSAIGVALDKIISDADESGAA